MHLRNRVRESILGALAQRFALHGTAAIEKVRRVLSHLDAREASEACRTSASSSRGRTIPSWRRVCGCWAARLYPGLARELGLVVAGSAAVVQGTIFGGPGSAERMRIVPRPRQVGHWEGMGLLVS